MLLSHSIRSSHTGPLAIRILIGVVLFVMCTCILLTPGVSSAQSDDDNLRLSVHVNKIEVLEENWVDAADLGHPAAEFRCYTLTYLESGYKALQVYPFGTTWPVVKGQTIREIGEVGVSITVPRHSDKIYILFMCVDRDQDAPEFDLASESFANILAKQFSAAIAQEVVASVVGKTFWDLITGLPVGVVGRAALEYVQQNDEIGEAFLILEKKNGVWPADGRERSLESANGALRFWYEVRATVDPDPNPPDPGCEASSIPRVDCGRNLLTEQWDAFYYANATLDGPPELIRYEPDINLDTDDSPLPGFIDADQFSVRWERAVDLAPGNYRFTMRVDDGGRLYVNDRLLIDEWRSQSPTPYLADYEHQGGELQIRMEYFDSFGKAVAQLDWKRLTSDDMPRRWRGVYYNNPSLKGAPSHISDDAAVKFNWGVESPQPGAINADQFSVRWTRTLYLAPGVYRFFMRVDDGGRLYVNDRPLIDEWHSRYSPARYVAEYEHTGGRLDVRVEYFDSLGAAAAHLEWERLTAADVPRQWRAVYYNNPSLEGASSLIRNDEEIAFRWGMASPEPQTVNTDQFSVQWTRTLDLAPGIYHFIMRVDDGGRLYVNDRLLIDEWRSQPPTTFVAEYTHAGGELDIRMEYFDNYGEATALLELRLLPSDYWSRGWHGAYYNNPRLEGSPSLIRNDEEIAFEWGNGSPELQTIGTDQFSARWTQTLELPPGTYHFRMKSDDGSRLYVNDQLLIDAWYAQSPTAHTADYQHSGGDLEIRMEYFEGYGEAAAHLTYKRR